MIDMTRIHRDDREWVDRRTADVKSQEEFLAAKQEIDARVAWRQLHRPQVSLSYAQSRTTLMGAQYLPASQEVIVTVEGDDAMLTLRLPVSGAHFLRLQLGQALAAAPPIDTGETPLQTPEE